MKMKTNRWLLVALVAIVSYTALSFVATDVRAQSVTTDRYEYRPGNTVTIIGNGWMPGETVTLLISGDAGTNPDVSYSVQADDNGNFLDERYTVNDSAPDEIYTITATGSNGFAQAEFLDPSGEASLCADVPSHGAGVCGGLANDPAGFFNNTHYAQIVGSTVDYQIRWAASETPNFLAETTTANGCAIGQVLVQIKSSVLGNTTTCGTVDGTGKIISFTWTSPQNACQTGTVAFRQGTTGGGNPDFELVNNDIIKDGVEDGSPTAVGGIANVSANNTNTAASCAAVTTEIHLGDDHSTGVTSVPEGSTVHDKATVTGTTAGGTPTGTVTFTFFTNDTCTPTGTAAGTVTLVNGVADPSTAFGPLTAGFYSFRAHYNGNGTYDPADGPCEPLEVTGQQLEEVGQLQACKYEDSNANGANNSEPALAGWSMTIDPVDGAAESATQVTDQTGCVLWTNLTPGSYTVTEATPAGGLPWFNTDPGPLCLIANTSSTGWDTCPEPSKDATVTANVTSTVYFGNLQSAEKDGQKFYDANANGDNDDGKVVEGLKITLTGTAVDGSTVGPTDVFTDSSGNYSFPELLPGDYKVEETLPNGNWFNTTPTSITFTLDPGEKEENNDFGNLCFGKGGGLTLGFWSNKNGQAKMNDAPYGVNPELAMLSGLCLRKANGDDFNPSSYSNFRNWLLSANATNMAYMLSAQLAAMELNVEGGFVSGGSLVYAPGCGNTGVGNNFISVNDLMTAANNALCADGLTLSGDPNRAPQECLKNALDRANNNQNFVQANACTFTSPY